MVIAVMVAGLFMNASLTRAFGDAAWVFVATLLGIQLGRTAWMLTTRLDPINHEHFVRTLVWLAATAPLWIIGAAVSADIRVAVWGAAAAFDLTGTWLAHPLPQRRLRSRRLEFGGAHLIERCRLFLLIAGDAGRRPGDRTDPGDDASQRHTRPRRHALSLVAVLPRRADRAEARVEDRGLRVREQDGDQRTAGPDRRSDRACSRKRARDRSPNT